MQNTIRTKPAETAREKPRHYSSASGFWELQRCKRMHIIRLFAACLSCCILLTACNGKTQGEDGNSTTAESKPAQTAAQQNLCLPYSKADGLDPYKCESMVNRQLCTLLYDSLFRLDAAYTPQPLLAQSAQWQNKTQLLVTLRSAVFSDGATLESGDVIRAFESAKKSPAYSQRLANVQSAKEENGGVLFTLAQPDPYAQACLDFAIAKTREGSLPLGGGRYCAKEEKGEMTLSQNPRYTSFEPQMKTITLADVSDSAALPNAVVIGNIHFALQELSAGEYQRINATTGECSFNNLVFLGFNNKKNVTQTPSFRKAVNLLLERDTLVLKAFQNHARAAYTPFNPDWYAFDGKSAVFRSDETKANTLLEEVGFTQEKKQQTEFVLLCNADNGFKKQAAELIAQQLAEAGLRVKVNALAFKEYEAAVHSGSYDLYLGEVRLCANMDLLPFFEKNGSVRYGIAADGGTAAAYQGLREGTLEIEEFLSAYREELPFLAICYRNGVTACTRSLRLGETMYEGDIYAGIAQWVFL